jgi:hypothetical protein
VRLKHLLKPPKGPHNKEPMRCDSATSIGCPWATSHMFFLYWLDNSHIPATRMYCKDSIVVPYSTAELIKHTSSSCLRLDGLIAGTALCCS